MLMSGKIFIAATAFAMLSVLGSCGRGGSEQRFDYEEASDIQDSVRRNELGIPLDGYVTYQSRVSRGEFFSNILNGYGVSNQRIYRIRHKREILDGRIRKQCGIYRIGAIFGNIFLRTLSIQCRRSNIRDIDIEQDS